MLVAVDEFGNFKSVKLCDFGVSRSLAGTGFARTMVCTILLNSELLFKEF